MGFQAEKKSVTPLQLSFLNNNNQEKRYFYFLSKFCMCRWQLSIAAPQATLKYMIFTVSRLTVTEHWDNTALNSEGFLNSVLDRKKSLTNIFFEKVHVCWSSICAIRNPASKKGIWCLCRRWKGAFFFFFLSFLSLQAQIMSLLSRLAVLVRRRLFFSSSPLVFSQNKE